MRYCGTMHWAARHFRAYLTPQTKPRCNSSHVQLATLVRVLSNMLSHLSAYRSIHTANMGKGWYNGWWFSTPSWTTQKPLGRSPLVHRSSPAYFNALQTDFGAWDVAHRVQRSEIWRWGMPGWRRSAIALLAGVLLCCGIVVTLRHRIAARAAL